MWINRLFGMVDCSMEIISNYENYLRIVVIFGTLKTEANFCAITIYEIHIMAIILK